MNNTYHTYKWFVKINTKTCIKFIYWLIKTGKMKYMLWRSTIMELNSPIFMILSMSVSWLVKIFNMYQYNSTASTLIELKVTFLAAMCCLVDFNYSSKVINPVDFRSIESNICCLTASSASVLYSLVSASTNSCKREWCISVEVVDLISWRHFHRFSCPSPTVEHCIDNKLFSLITRPWKSHELFFCSKITNVNE